ncbi:MAG TPA: glycosyltransferase [Bryobacteraceae bacterium]|nr:glycosyltransferase [Bryobacteraceae bacterium]
MKILWVKADFLHPTTRGGQIRTLETLKRLHRRHEIHYVGIENPAEPEGVARSSEYCTRAYPVRHSVADKNSLAFAGQLVRGLYSPLPVAVERYRSAAMRQRIAELTSTTCFGATVCDFLFPALNFPDLSGCILFQHNVEAAIWRRHASNARDPLRRWYFQLQARRMEIYEREVCRSVRRVIAVSAPDAAAMRDGYGTLRVAWVPTGVDVEAFARPRGNELRESEPRDSPPADVVFLGSMDWMPNQDGARWFVEEVFPRIRARKADCTVAIVGRRPDPATRFLAERFAGVTVTGTVDDVRPYLWGARISIVPLRVGGGTRLKIYEAMAAGVPVVSTAIGAEGLDVSPGENISIADTPGDFADACVALLEGSDRRESMAAKARELVHARYSWDEVAKCFERLLV